MDGPGRPATIPPMAFDDEAHLMTLFSRGRAFALAALLLTFTTAGAARGQSITTT